jgi:FkbM family methyltransferase
VPNFVSNALRTLLRARQARLSKATALDIRALLDGDEIAMLDVGASGGIIPRWHPYRENIAFTAIEPDERSIPELVNSPDARAFGSYQIIPAAAWSRNGPLGLSFTRKPMCSSHFKPNLPFLSRFPDAARFDVVGSSEIECRTVDDLLASTGKQIDFIKLDLEGGELAVLEGAPKTLETCIGLHVEVCFQTLRENQPLFGDIARFLHQRGLEFMDFVSLLRWQRDSFDGLGQAIFGDALFLRPPENLMGLANGEFITARRARVYVAILAIYERYDLALKFIDLLRAQGRALSAEHIERLRSIVSRRKARFDRRFRFASGLGRSYSRIAGQNYSFHYLY